MELSLNEMSKVTGGKGVTVNTGVAGLNAALRAEPKKSSRQIASIPNGTRLDTVTGQLVFDEGSQRNFLQVNYNVKIGCIAASIIGMPR